MNATKVLKSKVSDIMQLSVTCLHPNEHIDRARDIFRKFDIHHIPVVKTSRLIGIVSLGDLLYRDGQEFAAYSKMKQVLSQTVSRNQLTMADIMTKNPVTVYETDAWDIALNKMIKHRINCLPVVDGDDCLLGLVTTYDILKFVQSKNLEI